ncbi:5-formyltetrahydrofolate cyclo-ligase [Flavobacterium aquatile]|uniref:5-formyltetrahydrofolate cyclo-ligase n=1 Tax=Flavobacterium aquatile LMG 4008 = ATCC 11947 TaxID=1453498 RepID=A0A095SS00_9FLAO|nr:5-formyltetrahydrofolate cyclo-ligase [Flavobacterium aquatile]KGD67104.1 5-formyltetrahydrofolate cyclo-ligase [Flavobacterium aquatile LMG 4008 = ATCC 11947]OXA66735.1 5-formyltetrahydrofolate cyclo-ligase [Flavobacterium aquatile LMG 4008 = ATCC 11947]GEC78399.1 5-formyltetrahydrofolate cyclo-ligase [Flavobacterium aquatile]
MYKKELRQKYKALRRELTLEEIENNSLAIANNLLPLAIWDRLYFHLFLTIEEQKEIDTEFILQVLAGKDKEIVVAKTDFNSIKMTHYLLTDNTKFKKNEYNIPEPVDGIEVPVSKIDVVFVPLLAFDTKGNRVGYGKGFYDKFLSQCQPETIKIGLSFFEAEEEIVDVYQDDIRLDYCITPNKIYNFS